MTPWLRLALPLVFLSPAVLPATAQEPAADCCPSFDFATVPPAPRPLARLGLFPVPPTGPGYHSALAVLTGDWRDAPPRYPFPPFALSTLPFFDADWRFVDEPGYDPDWLERIKRMRVGDDWLVATGGQAWMRYEDQYNSRLDIRNNDFTLTRVRPYLDVWYRDRFRFFIEGIFADSIRHELPPLGTDINRADFQNLFAEARLGDLAGKPVFARVGRQEVQLGSQRLVATPDWGNTRRTFQGVRFLRTAEKLDADLFWLQPVLADPARLDSGDNNQNLAGAFVTYRPGKSTALDAYYLMLDNTNRITQLGINRAPFTLHTIGGRIVGDVDGAFLYEVESAMQLGRRGSANIVAGMVTGGAGYHWKEAPWHPTFWMVYNYTSGDDDPNAGAYHTFNQLFPFIQYYNGWVDAVGRQNLHDLNLRLYLYPTNWVTVWLQYHRFWLDSATDALYNTAGNASRRDPTGRAGTDVGQKAEVLLNFHLSKRTDLYTGYSYLWGGDFLHTTAGPTAAVDGSLFFLGYSVRW